MLARRTYDEPLNDQVGTVEADDRELAIVYARTVSTTSSPGSNGGGWTPRSARGGRTVVSILTESILSLTGNVRQ